MYNKEVVDILRMMTGGIIMPEPQCNVFMKYLARQSRLENEDKEALVYITNSHGLHLRNDVRFWKDKREECCNEFKINSGPVIDISHLQLFKNYDDIIRKIKELPEEWTVIQITKDYEVNDILRERKNSEDCGFTITRFSCGKLAERLHPYHVNIKSRIITEKSIVELLKDLIKVRRECFSSGGTNRKMKEEYANMDPSLMKLVVELENHWLKEWRCLLGGRLEDEVLEKQTQFRLKQALENFFKCTRKTTRYTEECFDILYQITLSAHIMKNKEILRILNLVLCNNEVDYSKELFILMEDIKKINLANSCAVKRAEKYPVILIIDDALDLIPWEMISLLSCQPVCRVLSLHLLYALFKFHQPHIEEGYRKIKVNSGFCLVNPNNDLQDCEKEITQLIKRYMPWIKTEAGKVPNAKALVSKFEDYDVIFYCGHGSGMQFLKSSDLKKSFVKGLVLLFGCSSNLPKSVGGRTPYHNDTHTYTTNGCPLLIGCIYDITSVDADIACSEMLLSFMPIIHEDSRIVQNAPINPDVLRGVASGKLLCRRYWSQCAFVARGIPCKTEN